MEVVPAKIQRLGFLLHRWRVYLLCALCVAVLSGLCVSRFADSSVSNPLRQPDSWLYLLSVRSGALSKVKIQSNNRGLPHTTLEASGLDISLIEEKPEAIYLDKADGREVGEDLGNSDINSGDEKSALSGEELQQIGTVIEKLTPIPESPPMMTATKNTPSSTDDIPPFHKGENSHHDDENLLQLFADNAGKETSLTTSHQADQCDMSVGKWVYDASYPLYQPSCPYVDEGLSCQKNGRPDSGYMRWRWKPKDCEIPRFNGTNLLERLRGKRLVFAGDSLNRNQWESMLCLLREALSNKNRMFETRGQRITKGKGAFVFKFLDYNCKVEFYRSHYLVAEGKQPRPGSSKRRLTLRLDTIDRTAKKWREADILVFTTGHWWSHSKTAKGKNYYQEGNVVYGRLPVMMAFRKAMTTWGSWIDSNVNPKSTKVFFCGYSPAHFNGGQWDSGGTCHKETDPIFDESYIESYPEKMLVLEDTVRQMRTPVKLLNVTRFSAFRKDAHPSVYGHSPNEDSPARRPQDCSHWCLPGLPDIWNEVLHALLIRND